MPRAAGIYGKMETTDCHSLTIGAIARYSGLQPGFMGTVRWLRGECETGSVGYRVLAGAVHIAYSYQQQDHAYTVRLTYTALVSGGERPWWTCPACARRCGVLYLRGGALACRRCHDLAYASQHTRIRTNDGLAGYFNSTAWGRALLAEVAAELAADRARQRDETRDQVRQALGDNPRPPGRPRTKRRYTRRV